MNKSLIGIVLGIGAVATALCAKIYYDERDQPEPEIEDEAESEEEPEFNFEPESEFDYNKDQEEAYKEPDFTSAEPEFEFDESQFSDPDSFDQPFQEPEEESYIHFEQELESEE